jgi:predicted nucleic acid-binding protein
LILVDTSVWIDHFRVGDAQLVGLLRGRRVLTHKFVVGELAMGNFAARALVMGDLRALPAINMAMDDEVLQFIDRQDLFGRGIGYINAHLLAATRLTPGVKLWTRDKRLAGVAEMLKIEAAF